jgi:hypothetical protein
MKPTSRAAARDGAIRVMAKTFRRYQRKLLSELDIWSETWITFEFIS